MDAALVVTDERIRRFLGVAVDISAPRLGCVTASSLGGTNSGEIEVAADDVALIQFSSGTTHDPKPVALTHANLLSNLAAIERYLTDEGAPNPVGVTWLPLYHDMGLIGNLLSRVLRSRPAGPASARAVRRGTGCVASRHLTTPGHVSRRRPTSPSACA